MHKYIIRRYNWNYKIFKSAPTCFGPQRIHHQGGFYSAWLKLQKCFCRVRWRERGRCYGSILWPVVLVCSSLYRKGLRNLGGGLNTPNPPPSVRHCGAVGGTTMTRENWGTRRGACSNVMMAIKYSGLESGPPQWKLHLDRNTGSSLS